MNAHLLAVLLALFGMVNLQGCFEAPGEGKKAEEGYRVCEPIIAALSAYRSANAVYPDSLEQLLPDYLPAMPDEPNGNPVSYQSQDAGASYILGFSYTGPGMNRCEYSPETKWRCHGYY